MAADGRDVRQLTFGATIQEVPKWSPDGRWITFDASRLALDDPAFSTSIWIMRADGSKARQLTSDGFDVEPVFSPDGSQIAFARITGTSPSNTQLSAIYVVNTDGTQLRQIVAALPGLEHPDWSPDSRWVSFNIAPDAVDGHASGSVLGVHPNGKGLRVLRESTTQFGFFKPVWSPDGRKLLTGCHDNQAQIDKLCILDTHSRRVEVVIDDTPDPVNYPAWGSHANNS
jgi:Tol biopolymer transport system component